MTEPYRTKGANAFYEGGVKHPQFGGGGGGSKENRLFEKSASITSTLAATSLRNKRFQSSYCAKVRAGAKKKGVLFPTLSTNSRGNACYAGYLHKKVQTHIR